MGPPYQRRAKEGLMSYSTPNFNDVFASCQLDRSGDLLDTKTIRRAFADVDCDFGHQEHTVFDKSTTLWAFLREILRTGTRRNEERIIL